MKIKKNKRDIAVDKNAREWHAPQKDISTMDISRQRIPFNNVLVKPGEKWFDQLPKDENKRSPQPTDLVMSLNAEAHNLLDEDTKLYNKYREKKKDKDFLWIKKLLQSGTISDKVSVHTLLIQDSPVHNLDKIEILVGMVNTKGKRECLMAMDALNELFVSELLVENRKLKPFNERPLADIGEIADNNATTRKRILVLWLFEDKLKSVYLKFTKNLDLVTRDTVEKTKQKAITIMFNLLKENPEQEQFLLEHLVNKIGDPLAKVGSHVCHLLGQLLDHHPRMNGIVMQEVERVLFRPNIAERAKYYSLCFLNQIILNHDEFELANRLITIYFGQFKVCISKGDVNTKMMSALLTGVARAYPFAKLKDNVIMEQLDAMYRLVHMVDFNISIQALMLIFQVLDSSESISDRFYCVLYRKLTDPALGNSSRQSMLLNLIYRALKKDVSIVRVKAFVKRLLQVALYQTPNLQSGILILISEVARIHPKLLNSKSLVVFSDSDSEEHFDDAPDEDEIKEHENEDKKKILNSVTTNIQNLETPAIQSWIHKPQRLKKRKSKTGYDLDARNPLHSGAEFSKLWELLFLKRCFHPSVALFAHQICSSKEIKYSGDPLMDFTTARFLDRFVYRNPKKPSDAFTSNTHRKVFGGRKLRASASNNLPVTSDAFLQQGVEKVPVEERYIYHYLRQRASEGKHKRADSDIESVCSEDFQKLLNDIHPEDEGKNTLNFARELNMQKQKKALKRKANNDSEEDVLDSDDNDSDLEAESEFEDELDFDGDEDFRKAFGDLNEEFEDLGKAETDICEEDFIDAADTDFTSTKPRRKKARKNESLKDGKLFASAEEFSAMLEDNVGNEVDTLTVNAFANKDKSGAKQLAWERQRDHFVKGKDWKRKNKKFSKKKKLRK